MIFSTATYGQQSLDIFGLTSNSSNNSFRLNGFESGTDNYNGSKDWEFSIALSGINSKNISGNISAVSFSKRLNRHYIYARYTPGFVQQFLFNSGVSLVQQNNVNVETVLKTQLDHKEIFGLGYSYKFSDNLNAGFSVRYFNQQFSEEQPDPYFTDTLNYITYKTEVTKNNYWRGDIGFTYSLNNNFDISVSSINLLTFNESTPNETANKYSMKKERGFSTKFDFRFNDRMNLTAVYENSNSFLFGGNISNYMFGGITTYGIEVFHDKYQEPFIAGIAPSINFSTELFSVTLSAVKYLENRQNPHTVMDLAGNGLHNILNNKFSFDRLTLGINVALSFLPKQSVKFIDVDLREEIYPTLEDYYLNNPFAVARVANITDKTISVKPSSFINEINSEIVYSPSVNIPAYDTIKIPFYTVINSDKPKINRREIAQANFYLSTNGDNSEDRLQKPILVNDMNSWDGNVHNLKYFVKKDLEFANQYSKTILQENENKNDPKKYKVDLMNRVKTLFDNFVKNMNYVADPRSSVEIVQFPNETIKLKGGDCDDLSVCFAAVLEGIGIQTAFVDYKNPDGVSHVNLLFNTGLTPEYMDILTNNDQKIVVRKNLEGKDELWIPLETTSLTNFETAWSVAAEKFNKDAVDNLGLAKGSVVIVDIF